MCVIWIHRPIINLVSYEYGCHCFPALFITHYLLKPTGQRFLFQADDHSSLEIPCLLVQSKTETPVRPMTERYFSLSHPFSLMNFVHVGILFQKEKKATPINTSFGMNKMVQLDIYIIYILGVTVTRYRDHVADIVFITISLWNYIEVQSSSKGC